MNAYIQHGRTVQVEEQTHANQVAAEMILTRLIYGGLPIERGATTVTSLEIRRTLPPDGQLVKAAIVTMNGRKAGTVVNEGESWAERILGCIESLDVRGADNGT